ncbi:MAG: VPLPA-CTERM sorting domain-containing protein [Gammaproteobacteria bacterium]|nr:VPLPA-CTERM sorting domain-containing protein [Gammaproteobacteria bacterium]
MPSANIGAVGRRACVAAALALSISSIPAHAVTVDGNLTDLIAAVGSNPFNTASATDPLGSADSPTTESNNGFDIHNVYAFYDRPADVLYLGLSVYGTVGNSSAVGASGTTEGFANAGTGSNSRTVFDANETYGIQLYLGTSTSDPQLLLYNVVGLNNGSDTVGAINNPWSLSITRSVSEANNGVEFSISGLYASGALPPNISYATPADLLIRFSAGSADTTGTTTAAEDYNLLQMQVVPVPAAAWLFGSGLAGLCAAARNRRKTA